MSIWRFTFMRFYVGLIVITVGILFWAIEPLSPAQRCEVARAKIEVYEQALLDPEVYLLKPEKRDLIRAKVEEIKWCKDESPR